MILAYPLLTAVALEVVHRVYRHGVLAYLLERLRVAVHLGSFPSTNNSFCFLAREIDSDQECWSAGSVEYRSAARICREGPERRCEGSYGDRPER